MANFGHCGKAGRDLSPISILPDSVQGGPTPGAHPSTMHLPSREKGLGQEFFWDLGRGSWTHPPAHPRAPTGASGGPTLGVNSRLRIPFEHSPILFEGACGHPQIMKCNFFPFWLLLYCKPPKPAKSRLLSLW